MRAAIIGALMVGAVAHSLEAHAEILHYRARLSPAAPAAPHVGGPAGLAEITLDTDAKSLSWRVSFAGLSGPVLAAHFRTPREPGSSVSEAMDFSPPYVSPMANSTDLTDAEIGDLRAGLWSITLITRKHPEGEIAGPLERIG